MTQVDQDQREFDSLLGEFADGEISDSRRERLAALMAGDASRIRLYLQLVCVHEALQEEGAVQAARVDVQEELHAATATPVSRKQSRGRPLPAGIARSRWRRPAITAAIAAIVLLAFTPALRRDRAPHALLATSVDADWAAATAPESFADNSIHQLDAGLVCLRFRSGASAVVEGPARFAVLGDKAIRLDRGKLVALCETKTTHGFTVEVPQGRVVDLGTEFGVEVADEEVSRARVFDGEIQLFLSSSPSKLASRVLREGEAIEFTSKQFRPVAIHNREDGFQTLAKFRLAAVAAQQQESESEAPELSGRRERGRSDK